MASVSQRKPSISDIVNDAYLRIVGLHPTPDEIKAYAEMKKQHGEHHRVVTYDKYKRRGDLYFIRFHDVGKPKKIGRVHIEVGYVDKKLVKEDVPDTIKLTLDKDSAFEFIHFVTERRITRK